MFVVVGVFTSAIAMNPRTLYMIHCTSAIAMNPCTLYMIHCTNAIAMSPCTLSPKSPKGGTYMIIQHKNFGSDRVIRCGIHEHTHNYGAHIHQHSELVYVLEGSIESTVDGKTETVNAGEMVVIPPLRIHSTYTPYDCKIFICVFSNDFILNFVSSKELYGGYASSVFKPSEVLNAYITQKLIPSALSYRYDNVNKYRAMQAGIHAVFEEYLLSTEPSEQRSPNNALAQILIYMNENYKEKLTLSHVGKALGYSAGYISHCMEALPKMNFNDVLNSFRIEHAKTMLLAPDNKTNIDIALESGFSCERSFYRAFTKAVKMTPKEYIARRTEKLTNSIAPQKT